MIIKKKNKIKWNIFDKIIAKFRYIEVDKFVDKNAKIVDVGCGQERTFLKRHKGEINQGYGFDFKINNYELDNLKFINNSNLDKFPLENESIDTVFMNAVLEHLEAPESLLLNLLEILKSNGKLIMTTPTPILNQI